MYWSRLVAMRRPINAKLVIKLDFTTLMLHAHIEATSTARKTVLINDFCLYFNHDQFMGFMFSVVDNLTLLCNSHTNA